MTCVIILYSLNELRPIHSSVIVGTLASVLLILSDLFGEMTVPLC